MSEKTGYFFWAFWGGMVMALLWLLLTLASLRMETSPWPYGFLLIALPHMAVIIVLGFLLPEEEKAKAGAKIQTAGYLHTLIGFSIVLLLLARAETIDAGLFLGPLGSALVTSILGWLFGGELVGQAHDHLDDRVRSEGERLAAELQGFTSAVRSVHEDYIRAVRELGAQYETLHEDQARVLRTSKEGTEDLLKALQPMEEVVLRIQTAMTTTAEALEGSVDGGLGKVLNDLESCVQDVNRALQNVAANATNAAQYLRESRILVVELEKLIDHVTRTRSTQ